MRTANQEVASEALRKFRLSTFLRGYWGHICMLPSSAPPTYAHIFFTVTVSALQQDGRCPLSSVQLTEWLQSWREAEVLALISLFAFYKQGRRKLSCYGSVSTGHPSLPWPQGLQRSHAHTKSHRSTCTVCIYMYKNIQSIDLAEGKV